MMTVFCIPSYKRPEHKETLSLQAICPYIPLKILIALVSYLDSPNPLVYNAPQLSTSKISF